MLHWEVKINSTMAKFQSWFHINQVAILVTSLIRIHSAQTTFWCPNLVQNPYFFNLKKILSTIEIFDFFALINKYKNIINIVFTSDWISRVTYKWKSLKTQPNPILCTWLLILNYYKVELEFFFYLNFFELSLTSWLLLDTSKIN